MQQAPYDQAGLSCIAAFLRSAHPGCSLLGHCPAATIGDSAPLPLHQEPIPHAQAHSCSLLRHTGPTCCCRDVIRALVSCQRQSCQYPEGPCGPNATTPTAHPAALTSAPASLPTPTAAASPQPCCCEHCGPRNRQPPRLYPVVSKPVLKQHIPHRTADSHGSCSWATPSPPCRTSFPSAAQPLRTPPSPPCCSSTSPPSAARPLLVVHEDLI